MGEKESPINEVITLKTMKILNGGLKVFAILIYSLGVILILALLFGSFFASHKVIQSMIPAYDFGSLLALVSILGFPMSVVCPFFAMVVIDGNKPYAALKVLLSFSPVFLCIIVALITQFYRIT